jgi:hypothetical protein
LKFEHLIEVNDLANPLLTRLSREELWFGLLCRAEDARAFLPGLEACRIIERSAGRLVRDLHFGNAVIRDCVTFEALRWIRFESEANEQHAGGGLTITIEEPEPGASPTAPRCPRAARMAATRSSCVRPTTSPTSTPCA